MFGLAGPIHNATHYGDPQLFNAWIDLFPFRHSSPEVLLNIGRQFLKNSTGRSATARTGRNAWGKATDPEALKNVLADADLLCSIASRCRRQADSNRVANSL